MGCCPEIKQFVGQSYSNQSSDYTWVLLLIGLGLSIPLIYTLIGGQKK